MNKRAIRKRRAWFITYKFAFVLAAFGILSFWLPHQKYSPVDNRDLAVYPHYSDSSLFSGFYLHAVDSVYADNFPCRDQFVSVSFVMKSIRGYHQKNIGFYKTVSVEEQVPVEIGRAHVC